MIISTWLRICPGVSVILLTFVINHHGHIVTGDLRMIENNRINLGNCLQKESILRTYIPSIWKMPSSSYLKKGSLDTWYLKNEILHIVKNKVSSLENIIQLPVIKPTLNYPEVRKYIEYLHSKYLLVPIDKASNNIAIIYYIICKQF